MHIKEIDQWKVEGGNDRVGSRETGDMNSILIVPRDQKNVSKAQESAGDRRDNITLNEEIEMGFFSL